MYCVIVGDIVNSREITSDVREKVAHAAQSIFDQINTDYIDSLIAAFGVVRGDAFEGAILTHYHAPQIVQDIIKAFYRVEKTVVRISVVLGELTVIGNDSNTTDGPAFHVAFDNIEKMKNRKNTHWLQVSFDMGTMAQPLVDSNLALLSTITESWTDKQREIVWAMEAHDSQKKIISKKMGISPSVVSKQLKATGYDTYCQTWKGLTEYLVNLDKSNIVSNSKSYIPYFSMALRELQLLNIEFAQLLFEKALNLAEDQQEQNDPRIISLYNASVKSHLILSRRKGYSEKTIQKSLQQQENLPRHRMKYAETFFLKALIDYSNGDQITAIENFQCALDIARNTLREKHPFLVVLNKRFALLYYVLGEYENALRYFNDALTALEDNIGQRPLGYAEIVYLIACCYCKLKDYKQAIFNAKQALSLFEDNLLPNHPYINNVTSFIMSPDIYSLDYLYISEVMLLLFGSNKCLQ